GLRLVVATALGLCAHLLLVPRPQFTGVDHTGRRHPRRRRARFPHHLFVTFFTLHMLVVWAAIYLTWGRGMRPTWRSYRGDRHPRVGGIHLHLQRDHGNQLRLPQ